LLTGTAGAHEVRPMATGCEGDGADGGVRFRWRTDLPGIEIRDIERSWAPWDRLSTGFELLLARTWRGEILHRGRRQVLAPGMVLSVFPGEVFSVAQVARPGALSALTIDADVFARNLGDAAGALPIPEPSRRAHVSAALAAPFERVRALVASGGPPFELGESVARLLIAAVMLFGPSPAKRAWRCPVQAWTAEPTASFIARGLSRHQAWRAFKRHYGLPPHDYQLRVRIGLAQRALREGRRAADIAADYGFVDQSHLCRHFKRLVGVTPSAYASNAVGVTFDTELRGALPAR
jgi:AraC-like DNA-binding protein